MKKPQKKLSLGKFTVAKLDNPSKIMGGKDSNAGGTVSEGDIDDSSIDCIADPDDDNDVNG